jgi:PBS lyase HEAT-like repeat-containing protein
MGGSAYTQLAKRGLCQSINGDVMKRAYGPAERLREQLEILFHDPDATDIVVASTLGENAVPILMSWLDGGKLRGKSVNAAVRTLGMIAAPTAVTSLGRLLGISETHGYSSGPDQRALVNALRKIGTPEALAALVANVQRLDLAHAKAAFSSFGEPARQALLSASPQNPAATRVLVLARDKDVIPQLVVRAEKEAPDRLEAIHLLAHFGKDAPKAWAVQRLQVLQNEITLAYLAVQRRGRRDGLAEHDALLTLLYHADDPDVLTKLSPLLPTEDSTGLLDQYGPDEASVCLLAICWGERAKNPLLKVLQSASEPAAVKAAAKKLLDKIPVREPYEGAFRRRNEDLESKSDDDFFGKRRPEEDYDDDE